MTRIATSLCAWLLLCSCVAAPARGEDELLFEDLDPAGSVQSRWEGTRCSEDAKGSLRAVRCLTSGKGTPALVVNGAPYSPPLDLNGRFLKVWIKVKDTAELSGLELRASSDGLRESYFAFPVALYADPEFNVLQPDEWTELTFSFGHARVVGTPDRARIDTLGWYVADRGKRPVELSWAGASAVRASHSAVLSLTFDDGSLEHFSVAAPAMARFRFPGTAYVIPDEVGNPGTMSLEQMHELHAKYGWEIAGHHGYPLTQFSGDDVERMLIAVQRYLRLHDFGPGATHFAFPLGKIDRQRVLPAIRKHFATARLASSGPETLPPGDAHKLRVYNVLDTTTPEEVGAAARQALANGDWLILMLHHLRPNPTDALTYDPARFDRLLEEIRASGIPVKTVGEVWASLEVERAAQVPARPENPE